MSDNRAGDPGTPQDRTSFYQNDTSALPLMQGAEDMPDVTAGEAWRAGSVLARGERSSGERRRIEDAYRPILDVLNRGKRMRIWRGDTDGRFRNANPGQWAPSQEGGGGEREREEALIWKEIARIRAADPKALPGVPATIDDFHNQITEREAKARADARDLQQRSRGIGGWTAGLAGGLVQSLDDPLTIATLPIGGGGRTVAQRILIEGLANAGVEAVQQPLLAERRKDLGETLNVGEGLANIAVAGAFGSGVQGLVLEPLGAVARRVIGKERMTELEAGAANMIEREDDIAAASPFEPGAGTETHFERLEMAMRAMAEGDATPARPIGPSDAAAAPVARAAPISGAAARDTFKAQVRGAESGGNDAARNPLSSATGRYQFTDDTWLKYHRRVVGGEMTDAQRLAQRGDGAVQDRLMDRLTDDNAKALARIGARETAGNLYLMHFAGAGGGAKILKAAPDTPIETLLGKKAIAANPFLRGKTAADVIEWAHAKMGGGAPDGPVLKRGSFADDEAGDAEWRAAQEMVDAEAAEGAAARGVAETLPDVEGAAPAARVADAVERVDGIDPAATALPMDLEPMPERVRPAAPLPVRNRPSDVVEFLTDRGGLRDTEGHDLRNGRGMGEVNVWRSGRLIRNKGMTIDRAGELLHEGGFFTERPTTAQVLDMVERATNGGEKIYALKDSGTVSARAKTLQRAQDEGLRDGLIERHPYLDPEGDAELIDDVLARMVDGEDSMAALEFEVERRRENLLDRARHEAEDSSYGEDIPFDLEPQGGAAAAGGGGRAAEPGDPGGSGAARAADAGAGEPQGNPDALRAFDDPGGEGAARQIESLDHDLRMLLDRGAEADPDIAARQGQEARLKAGSPLQSTAEQQGTIGLGLFDTADQPGFRLDDAAEPRPLADILKEQDEEAAAIAAARACMAPPKGATE